MASLLAILLAIPSILLAYSLAVNTSSTLPLPAVAIPSFPVNLSTTNPDAACTVLYTCRKLDSIIQTCLVTVFACVWVAVHRNIPEPKSEPAPSPHFIVNAARWVWEMILDQRQSVIVFVVTLLAPEWVLAWAVRQAIEARYLAKRLEEARKEAERRWEGSGTEPAAEMADDEPNGSDDLPRPLVGDDVALSEGPPRMDVLHPLDFETRRKCMYRKILSQLGIFIDL